MLRPARSVARSATLAATLAAFAAGGCNCGHGSKFQSVDATPVATPSPLDFGAIPVNHPTNLPLTVADTGTLTLVPGTLTLTGPNAGDFRLLDALPASIGANNSAAIHVGFQPTAAGVRNATLKIPSNSSGTPVLDVPLTGVGGDVAIVATPQPLDFGDVLVNRSVTLPLTLTNQGSTPSAPIQIGAIAGAQASWFSQTSTPAAIPAGGTLVIQVTFTPQAIGAASANQPITFCGGCTPSPLTLVGQGVHGELTYVANPVSFPVVPVGNTVSQAVTATNTGTWPITVAGLDLQAGSSPAYWLDGGPASFPITLAPAGALPDAGPQSFTFAVGYKPAATTGDQGTIEAPFENVGGVPETATDAIYGNQTLNPCSLTFSPPGVNFGNASAGSTLKKFLTLGNVGQEACSLTGIQLDHTSDSSFVLPANPGMLTIQPSATAQIEVDFTLQNPGNPLSRHGELDYASNDTNHATGQIPLTAFLQGTSPYSAGWPKYHYDNTNRGQSEADTSGLQGQVIWKYPVATPSQATGLIPGIGGTGPTYMNSPVVAADGTIYQTTLDAKLLALNPDGTLKWSVAIASPAQDPHPATPIIAADGTLFLESGTDAAGGRLYHFAADGTQLDAVAPPSNLCNSNAATTANGTSGCPDGFDVCPSIGNDGLLYDGDDFGATVTYSVDTSGKIHQGAGLVLNYTGERVAVALDTNDNSYWCSANACYAVSSVDAGFQPLWGGGNGTTISSSVGAFDFDNSDLAWDRDHTGMLMVVVAPLNTITSSASTTLVTMNPASGNVSWSYPMPSFQTPTPPGILGGIFSADFGNAPPAVADDGTVYVGNGDGLYAFTFTGTGDATMGALKAGFPFKAYDVDTAPAIGGDGTVFFGCADGTFYALHPDGTERFKIVTGARVSTAPAIGPDGTVYFVSDEGNLYAVR